MTRTKLALATISISTALLLSAGAAQASSLSIFGRTAINFTGYSGQPATSTGVYSSGSQGTIVADRATTVSFTFLGSESNFNNRFSFAGITLVESNTVGATTGPVAVNAGALNFTFSDDRGGSASNGSASNANIGFAILDGNTLANGGNAGPFDFVLGFNDSNTDDADFDDFVVGINVSPVPLPTSLPLMAAALGLFTFARRKI